MGRAVTQPLWGGVASGQHQGQGEVFGHWLVSEDAVRLRAYFISLETGGRDPARDWKRAEQEFLAEAGVESTAASANPLGWLHRQ